MAPPPVLIPIYNILDISVGLFQGFKIKIYIHNQALAGIIGMKSRLTEPGMYFKLSFAPIHDMHVNLISFHHLLLLVCSLTVLAVYYYHWLGVLIIVK